VIAIAFVAAAILGAGARAEAGRRWNRDNGLALGTLSVNVSGSFLLGLLAAAAPPTLTVLGAGGLGAYTTFSSFARDTVALVELGRIKAAAFYVAATCILGIAAASAGIALATTT
jgi:CrcB protein